MSSNNKFSNIQLGGIPTNTFNPIVSKGSNVGANYNNYTTPYNLQPNIIRQTPQPQSQFNSMGTFGTFGTINNNFSNYVTSQPLTTPSFVLPTNDKVSYLKTNEKYTI